MLGCPRQSIPWVYVLFEFPQRARRPQGTRTLVNRLRPIRCLPKETGGPPIFPPNPNSALPYSPTPGGRSCQTGRLYGIYSARPYRPRYYKHEDSTNHISFEALSYGFTDRCLRFVPASRLTTQDSLAVVGQTFCAGVVTRRVCKVNFHRCYVFIVILVFMVCCFSDFPTPTSLDGAMQF